MAESEKPPQSVPSEPAEDSQLGYLEPSFVPGDAACPTGLSMPVRIQPEQPSQDISGKHAADDPEPGVEELEGRQEAARD